MKTAYIALLLMAIAIVTSSCKKQHENTVTAYGDYMIVGRAGGLTVPEAHTNYYFLAAGILKKDVSQLQQAPPEATSMFRFSFLMPQTDYAKVADLPATIPAEMLARNNSSIGTMQPDAGYIDLRGVINGIGYRWKLEGNLNDESPLIQAFAARIGTDFP